LTAIAQQDAPNTATILATPRVPDDTYQAAYNKYKKYLRENTVLLALDGQDPLWLTRHSIYQYFTHAVVDRNGVQNMLSLMVSSLQWFANHREYVGESFEVESATVNLCIEIQQERHIVATDT
jgi:hypothetical protein